MRQTRKVFLLVVLLLVASTGVVRAATPPTETVPAGPLNITLSPDSQDIITKPGVPVTVSIKVRNNGPQTEHLIAKVNTFFATGQNGTPQLRAPKSQDDFITWLTLPKTTLFAEPNVWEIYSFTISPPKTAAFGYYYAIDFSRVAQPNLTNGNNFVVSVDSLVLLDVQAPGEVRKASLVEFSTPNKLVEFLPENFVIRMHNDGNVHVAPRGDIFIYKGKKPMGIVEVNPSEGNILPGTFRKYTAQWKDGSPVYKTVSVKSKDGKMNDKVNLDLGNFKASKLRYGKYTAELQMIYNNGKYDVPLIATLYFWVIPWRIIIVGLLVLLFVLAGIWIVVLRPLVGRIRGGKRRGYARRR
jgi:hypothetical protein